MRIGLRLLATVAVFAVAVPAFAAATMSNPCAASDALASRPGAAIEAHLAYLDLADQNCAEHGEQLLARSWAEAKKEFEAGQQQEKQHCLPCARMRYVAALTRRPDFTEAAAALARLGHDPYLKAHVLAAGGFRTDALAALKDAAASGLAIPEDLRELNGGAIRGWRAVQDVAELYGRPAAEILALIILVAIIAGYFFGSPRLEIADFEDTAVEPAVGKNVTALFRERLKKFSNNYRPRLGLFEGPPQLFSLPKDVAATIPPSFSWINIIPAVIGMITPRRTLKVCGHLHPSGNRGAGLTITLTRRDRMIYSSTLWECEFDPIGRADQKSSANGHYALAEPAAIWLLFRLADAMPAGASAPKIAPVFGTVRWRSYALFNAATRFEDEARPAAAERLYVAALEDDADNLAARMNLGALMLENGSEQHAIDQLRVAKHAAFYDATPENDPVYYSAASRLAAALFNLGEMDEAEKETDDLLYKIDLALNRDPVPMTRLAHLARWCRRRQMLAPLGNRIHQHLVAALKRKLASSENDSLNDYLKNMRPSIELMKYGLAIARGEEVPAKLPIDEKLRWKPNAYMQYNLACTYAMMVTKAKGDERAEAMDRALTHLEFALRLQCRLAKWAEQDHSIDALKKHARYTAAIERANAAHPGLQPPPPAPAPSALEAFFGKLAAAVTS